MVITVAEDTGGIEVARPFIEMAKPAHPSRPSSVRSARPGPMPQS